MGAQDAQEMVAGLVASHGAQLQRFLLARIANRADVPDIAQEVYLRMMRIPNAESIRSPQAYLFTVAQHVLQQYTLKASATPRSVGFTEVMASSEADPVLEVAAQQCLEQLQRTLEDLSPKARATFLLHRREGLSLGEIALRLQISVPMVKKYLMNSLLHLRQGLEELE